MGPSADGGGRGIAISILMQPALPWLCFWGTAMLLVAWGFIAESRFHDSWGFAGIVVPFWILVVFLTTALLRFIRYFFGLGVRWAVFQSVVALGLMAWAIYEVARVATVG